MKTISKIFMAVVAGVLAFSCVTDTTEDQAVQLGTGQTTLSISLEESRTHLGVKDLDGKEYPLYWSKGDKIAVNGKASDALGEAYHGQTQATFKFTGTLLNYPYNIVYPAPAEGVKAATAGQQVVTFKTSQPYTANTFAEGSVPMYGHVEDENDATTLNHLTGVLRFALYGTDVTLNAMTLSAESGKLSGNFDVDCTTGELTAHADASNTLSVSFGTGLSIATTEAEATPIYVAVPEGAYGQITITFYSSKGAMTKLFNTAEKPIIAGNVREFAALEYEEGTTDTFIIYDETSLRNFANSINDTNAENVAAFNNTYPNARVVADIELTEPWVSINGYTGSFDGGNHTISGLNKPLFGITKAAAIKNVHLANVNIPSATIKDEVCAGYTIGSATIRANGALARIIDNTSAVVENCSADGTINIALVIDGYDSTSKTEYYFASLVGYSTSTQEFSDLTSRIELSIVDPTAHNTIRYVAGIVSYHAGSLNAAKHLGRIISDTGTGTAGGICVSGIAYKCLKTMSNCENGDKFDKTGSTGSIYVGSNEVHFKKHNVYVGGLAVSLPTSLNNCHNYANITISTNYYKSTYNLIVGGLGASNIGSTNIASCSNCGNITVESPSFYFNNYRIGGLVGDISTGTNTITNSHNTGNIHYNASKSSYTTNDTSYVGGLVGYVASTTNLNSCSNGGNITIDNKMADGKSLYVGGIVGASTAGTINSTNAFCDIKVSLTTAIAGMITGSAYDTPTVQNCNVGGSILKGVDTETVALSRSNYPAYIYGSGVDAETEKVVVNTDKCGWLASKDATNGTYKVFDAYIISNATDLIAWAANEAAASTDTVELGADIDLKAEGIDWTPFGAEANGWKSIEGFNGVFDGKEFEIIGLTAPLFGTTQAETIKNVKLTGVVINETENPVIGALARQISNTSAVVSNCSASGSLSVDYSGDTRPNIAGLIGKSTSTQTFTGLKNEVNITALSDGEYADGANHAGVICEFAGCLEDSQNLGTITVNTKTAEEQNTHIAIAGIANYCNKGVINCTNGEETNVTEDKGKKGALAYGSITRGHLFMGGIISGTVKTNMVPEVTGCKNYGNVEFTGSSVGYRPIRLSGVVALLSRVTGAVSGCENHGNIILSATHNPSKDTPSSLISGIANGDSDGADINNCENYGNMIVTEEANLKYSLYIGGLISLLNFDGAGENLYNYGQISVEGTIGGAIYAGGVAGCVNGSLKNNTVNDNGHITIDTPNVGDMANTKIGGIVGQITSTIDGARCFCNIQAVGFTNVGMVTGSTRNAAAPKVNNCAVGGSIAIRTSSQGEIEGPHTINLSAGNYYRYIYGSGVAGSSMTDEDWAGTDNYDGCGYIESIDDATPDYATPQPAEQLSRMFND
ncbi:MAG: hypothetical protein IKA04_01300 [Alistipes sp.]|nr:hypothetical protein [Alistipes sp.]